MGVVLELDYCCPVEAYWDSDCCHHQEVVGEEVELESGYCHHRWVDSELEQSYYYCCSYQSSMRGGDSLKW